MKQDISSMEVKRRTRAKVPTEWKKAFVIFSRGDQYVVGAMTLNIKTLSITTLRITTVSIMTLSITTLSMMTHRE
jgi:hypothetical protein